MVRVRPCMLFLVSVSAVACATPRSGATIVHRDPSGGVLALQGPDREAARQDAEQQMRAHCNGPYQIDAENRVAAGEQIRTRVTSDAPLGYPHWYRWNAAPGFRPHPPGAPALTAAPPWGLEETRTDSQSQPAYEYQLSYRCTGAR